MDLGSELRSARERAGCSLPELAARTRIPLKTLRAIEENDYSRIPPGIFVRSFIRTYAREVGLDPGEAIAEYRAMTEPVDEVPPAAPPDVVDEIQPRDFSPELLESRPGWGYALIAAALLVAIVSVNRYTSTEAPAARAPAPPAAVAAAASGEPAVPVATSGEAVRIELRALGSCWIRAEVDGSLVFARLLEPGESETLTGRDVILRIGDPAALAYSVNGRPGTPLGGASEPVTVHFNAQGRASHVL